MKWSKADKGKSAGADARDDAPHAAADAGGVAVVASGLLEVAPVERVYDDGRARLVLGRAHEVTEAFVRGHSEERLRRAGERLVESRLERTRPLSGRQKGKPIPLAPRPDGALKHLQAEHGL